MNATSLPTITHDPATWPKGDKLWSIARAIAFAEGAHKQGSNPDRLNNPGDLSDDFATYGGEHHSGSNITKYPDKRIGWDLLRNKLYRISLGLSKEYKPEMTWIAIAHLWAGNWQAWATNVAANLRVSPNSTFKEYILS